MKQKLTILLILLSMIFVSCEEDNFDMALAPEVTMGEVSDIYRTSAVLSADISRSENRSITESGFILSTFNDFEGMTLDEIRKSSACTVVTTDNPVTAGQLSLNVMGLQAKTHYYCCAFVSSGYSVARSDVKEFTTVETSAPRFSDIVFSDITVSGSKASFQLLDIGGEDEVQTLELWYKKVGHSESPTTLNKTECNTIVNLNVNANDYSATLSGLEQNTHYAVCVHIATTGGRTAEGEVACFTTDNINTTFAQSINMITGEDFITIEQRINNGNGENVVSEGVVYSSINPMPTEYDNKLLDNNVDNNVNVTISGLQEGQYYVRSFAQVNKDGNTVYVFGGVNDVTIEKLLLPKLSKCEIDTVASSFVRVRASVNNTVKCGERGFCYVEGTGTPTIAGNTVAISAGKPFYAELKSLKSDTDIIIRAYAINSKGEVGYSEPVTVHTRKKTPSVGDIEFPEVRP